MRDAQGNGSDEQLKTQEKFLGRILYSYVLESCQHSFVGEEIQNDNISLFSTNDPVEIVLSIVKLVAADDSTAHFTRLLGSFQDVMNCRRGVGE